MYITYSFHEYEYCEILQALYITIKFFFSGTVICFNMLDILQRCNRALFDIEVALSIGKDIY